MKVFLGNKLSCDLDYTYSLVEDTFSSSECEIVEMPEDADIIVFPGTCSGGLSHIEFTIDYIASILERKNPSAKTYLTGCIARPTTSTLDEKSKEYFALVKDWLGKNIDFIFLESEIQKMLGHIFPDNPAYNGEPSFGYAYKDNYLDCTVTNIYICQGCLNKCSFCKFNYQDVDFKSVKVEELKEIIDDINSKEKPQVIDLFGHNITQYGLDISGKYMLAEIINYVESKKNIIQLRLSALAFKDAIKQGLAETIKSSSKISFISSGLESGSDRILSLMKKGYTAKQIIDFMKVADSERKIHLEFNIIPGFPTETKEDIKRTVDLLNQLNTSYVNLLGYADSPFVPSHNLPQFSKEIIAEHAEEYIRQLNLSKIPYYSSMPK